MQKIDDIDIFGFQKGGSATEERESRFPELTPAQTANILGAFVDPLGLIDITGEFPEFPAPGVSMSGMVMQGPRSPSLAENLREGNFGAAALQSMGAIPVIGGAARTARGMIKAADRLAKAEKAGFDTGTVYYHATDKLESGGDFTQLMPSERGKLGPGVYVSPDPKYTERYIRTTHQTGNPDSPLFGDNARILPVFVRGKIGDIKDYDVFFNKAQKELDTSELSFPDARDLLKNKAKEDMAEAGFAGFKVGDELVIFDPKNVRSVNANFEDLDSPELLKASGGSVRLMAKGGIADLFIDAIRKGDFDTRFDSRVKEQEMLRNLEAEIQPSPDTQPMPPLALSELEGEDFVTSMADRTRAGGQVTSINRVQLVDPIYLPGGQDFMFNNPSGVWASAEQPSRQILELARELKSKSGKDPLYIPWRMAPSGGDFATTTGELMLGYAAANMTKATKKSLDKALRDYKTVGSIKDGKRVGAGVSFGKNWPGLDNPEAVEAWRNAPDALRKELMNMMDVQFRGKGGLSIGAARLINADPKQLTARDAGIQNVGRIFADIDIFDSAHPSYPFVVPGGGVGVLENASAATVFDLLPEARFGKAQKPVKDPANPTQQEIRALQMKPYGGTITEDILRRMEARGVDVNSIVGLTGGALTFTLLSAGLVTPQEVQAGALKEFAEAMLKADKMGFQTDQILYHGSTFDIEKFVPSLNSDNDFGQGTYFTVSPSDASRNYAGEGPDLTNRIELLAESIENSLESDWDLNPEFWGKINDPEVFAKVEKLVDRFEEDRDRDALRAASKLAAKTILKGDNEGVIYPVFVNNKEFAVIGGKNKTVIDIDREQYYETARDEVDRGDFQSDDDYEDAVFEYAQELENFDYESPIAKLAESLRSAGASDEATNIVIDRVLEAGEIDFTDINDTLRKTFSEDLDTGEMLNNGQIMQNLLVDMGYKGVVDNTVGSKFAGMSPGGMHTVVFPGNENLIRSINARFDPAKADSPNILASAPPLLVPASAGIVGLGAMQEAQAATRRAQGAPFEVAADLASSIAAPIAGGIGGAGAYGFGQVGRLFGADISEEELAELIRNVREGTKEALDFEPFSPEGKELSERAQAGIVSLLEPVAEKVAPFGQRYIEEMTRPDNVTPLGLLYRGGKYVYEDIFGDAEREAAKSLMDVVL